MEPRADTHSPHRLTTPAAVREGVRQGVADAIGRELAEARFRTPARFTMAGVLGLASAVGASLQFEGGSVRDGSMWHVVVCWTAWAGLLVTCYAALLMRIRIGGPWGSQTAAIALIGLALAAVLGWLCPEPHYLAWWFGSALGAGALRLAGEPGGVLLLGTTSAAAIALVSSSIVRPSGARPTPVLPATLLFFLALWPAVALQCTATSIRVFVTWSVGLLLGSVVGVALGIRASQAIRRRIPRTRRGMSDP